MRYLALHARLHQKDIVGWFRACVHDAGGGNYQTLINTALADWMGAHDLSFRRPAR